MKKILVEHFVSILLSLIIVSAGIFIFNKISTRVSQESTDQIIITGQQQKKSGRYAHFMDGDSAELDLMASLQNDKQVTLFGSSEFSELPLVSYNFFPDSLGKQMLGVGHAYHQHFSILLELMAADDFTTNSEICIFLSPGWFQNNGGTNTEAFIEFGRPNFLATIAQNPNLPLEYKKYIGEYIDRNHDSFQGSSAVFDVLRNLYLQDKAIRSTLVQFNDFIKDQVQLSEHAIQSVSYKPELTYLKEKVWNGNFDSLAIQRQTDFVDSIEDNGLFVYDAYYNNYLIREDGTERSVELKPINFETNTEFRDFKMVVNYIKHKQMKASFIIIPFNPYYYTNTEAFNPLIDSLTSTLNKNNIPHLNLYVSDTANYEPGTLKDVMHLGDYGWMTVNKYIDSLYYHE